MKVYLVGYMGVGKSTKGKALAKKLGLEFFDLDKQVEQVAGMSVSAIFARHGEARFREMEQAALAHLATSNRSYVLATGGGTPCHYDNMNLMLDTGIAVWLQMPVGAICKRIKQSRQPRPLLQSIQTDQELEAFITSHLDSRIPYYSKAQIKVDAQRMNINELKELAAQIKEAMQKRHSK